MKTFFIFLFLTLLPVSKSLACLNTYFVVDKHGHTHDAESIKLSFNKDFDLKTIQKQMLQLEQVLKKEKSYKALSDYAVCLLKIGQTEAALQILIALDKKYSAEYQIAANLGTAYELSGQVDKALIYIQKGILLNPTSHHGSEWVHVKILETKLALQKDPGYLQQHTVLNLTPGQMDEKLVLQQILIQAQERFPFSPAPDPIMASLLIDLGDCFASSTSIEYAKALYMLAKEYHGADAAIVDSRIKAMEKLDKKFSKVSPENENMNGFDMKISPVDHDDMVRSWKPYLLEWAKINTDAVALLKYAGLDPVKTATPKKNTPRGNQKARTSSQTKKAPFFLFGGAFLVIAVAIAAKRRNRRAR